MKIPPSFFIRENPVQIAKELLGKFLFTYIDDSLCGGIIIETEAYGGIKDKASHAYGNKKTNRNRPMYEKGGITYIYLCYGMHHLLNIVTNIKDIPEAVLIRAIKPCAGIDIMVKRRGKEKLDSKLCSGPGSLCTALGINMSLNRKDLSDTIWIEDRGHKLKSFNIIETPRVGVDYAKEHALLPWRFLIDDDKNNNNKLV